MKWLHITFKFNKDFKRKYWLYFKVNPTGSDECGDPKCFICSQTGGAGGGKICLKNKILYEAKCLKCADSKYIGESDRNLFTRGSEHEKNKSGFIIKHQNEKHNVEPPEFKWKVLKTFRDPELQGWVPPATTGASEKWDRERNRLVVVGWWCNNHQ